MDINICSAFRLVVILIFSFPINLATINYFTFLVPVKVDYFFLTTEKHYMFEVRLMLTAWCFPNFCYCHNLIWKNNNLCLLLAINLTVILHSRKAMADHYTLLKSQIEVGYHQNENFAITLFQVFHIKMTLYFQESLFVLLLSLLWGYFICFEGCWHEHWGQHLHFPIQCHSSVIHGPCWSQRKYSQATERGPWTRQIIWSKNLCYSWGQGQKHRGIIHLSLMLF